MVEGHHPTLTDRALFLQGKGTCPISQRDCTKQGVTPQLEVLNVAGKGELGQSHSNLAQGPQTHFSPQACSSLGFPDPESPSKAPRSPLLHHNPAAKVELSYSCPQLSLKVPSAHCESALHQGHSCDSHVPALSPRSSPSNRKTGTAGTQVMTHSTCGAEGCLATGGRERIQKLKAGRTRRGFYGRGRPQAPTSDLLSLWEQGCLTCFPVSVDSPS